VSLFSEITPGSRVPVQRFTPDEDARLRELVEEFGPNHWAEIASKMDGKNYRQCRERWKHYLSGQKQWCLWTPEEDGILIARVREIGPKWTVIALSIYGRTDIDVKNRYFKLLRAGKIPCAFQPGEGHRRPRCEDPDLSPRFGNDNLVPDIIQQLVRQQLQDTLPQLVRQQLQETRRQQLQETRRQQFSSIFLSERDVFNNFP
jgi:hypothetical protein